MIVFPAIDILDGKRRAPRAGRLRRGHRLQRRPGRAGARSSPTQGAEWIHVVDLDGARDGVPGNIDVIERIARESGLRVRGGRRHPHAGDDRRASCDAGVERMRARHQLVTDPEFVREACARSASASSPASTRATAWSRSRAGARARDARPHELVGELRALGVRHLVYTDIARDGMQTGVNCGAYVRSPVTAGFPVVASGGVSTLDDIRALAALGSGVIEGVIVGRALYEGAFTLAEALAAGARGGVTPRC